MPTLYLYRFHYFDPLRNKWMMAILAAFGFYLFAASAHAFEVDNYTSGMSVADLEKIVVRSDTQLRAYQQEEGRGQSYSAVRVDEKGTSVDILATFTTCAGKLTSYGHNVDFDADYASLLEGLLRDYGQPKKVYVKREPWSGPNGGYIVITYMTWYQGLDRVELSFVPEGRTSKGELRHSRTATIRYATKNACWLAKYW
jgi:hypothetical protein